MILRRAGLLLLALLVAAVAIAGLTRARHTDPTPPTGRDGTVRVGVHDGDSIPAYVAASAAELATLPAGSPVYALVSLSAYQTPAQIAILALRPGLGTVVAYARVPLPRRQTEIVRLSAATLPGDLVTAMGRTAQRKRDEAASAGAADAALDRAEADAYANLCACVYALVVRATPAVLRQLAHTSVVRAVDPAPEVTDPGRSVFVAPLPEQVATVVPPPDDATAVPRAPSARSA